jgi:hypothetical protein
MGRRSLKITLPLLAMAAGFAMLAQASSLVSDGGFESAALGPYGPGPIGDGWTVTTGTIEVGNFSDFAASPHSGSQMVYLDNAFTLNTFTQTLTTVVGQSYTISFWLADDDTNAVIVKFGNQTIFNGTAPTNGVASPSDYVNYTFTATATSTSTVLSIAGQYTESGFGTLLDDVSVAPTGSVPLTTPAPASLYLCLIGLAGVGLYTLAVRRRRVI